MNFSKHSKFLSAAAFVALVSLSTSNHAVVQAATPNTLNLAQLQAGELTASQALDELDHPAIDMTSLDTKTKSQEIKANKSSKKTNKKSDKKSHKNKKHAAKGDISARIAEILAESHKPPAPIVSYGSDAIMGKAVATPEQCLKYLLMQNPHPKLSVSPEEIVRYYFEEAEREGVRPDAAFAQALKETGYFNYGGTVTPDQNNYCGLGTTSATVKGAYFATAREGVRAHIQHLLAYATVRPPRTKIVDPRYMLVRAAYSTTTIDTWPGLNGRWAVPGNNYGQGILRIVQDMANLH